MSDFDADEVAARPALDEVAGDRERRAAEADERPLGLELGPHEPHRLEDRRRPLLRLGDPEPLDLLCRIDPLFHHRPDALDELHVDAHPEDGRHDVGEEDGGVDAVPAHRLQRHLRAELGGSGNLEEAVLLSQRAVLGQRAAGLPHEPDRRPLGRLAPQRANEKRLGAQTLMGSRPCSRSSRESPSSSEISGSQPSSCCARVMSGRRCIGSSTRQRLEDDLARRAGDPLHDLRELEHRQLCRGCRC